MSVKTVVVKMLEVCSGAEAASRKRTLDLVTDVVGSVLDGIHFG